LALYVHTYELAPNSAAAAGNVWRRRQPNFGRRGSARQPDLVRASRKTDGGAAEGSTGVQSVMFARRSLRQLLHAE